MGEPNQNVPPIFPLPREIIPATKGICVVMGNGMSLLDMPISVLEYDTFGVNHAPLQPTHYVCVDTRILVHRPDDVYDLAQRAKKAFLSGYHGGENERTKRLYSLPNIQIVHKDKDVFGQEMFMTGYNAAYVALKMAFYEGYETVYLWGVDHDWEWKHYSTDYPGARAKDPRKLSGRLAMATMKQHLDYANRVYQLHKRKILNFSKLSDLEFERGEAWFGTKKVSDLRSSRPQPRT